MSSHGKLGTRVPQNVVMGPCNVSFDMGFDDPVAMDSVVCVHTETLSGIKYDKYTLCSSTVVEGGITITIGVLVDPEATWPPRDGRDSYPREIDGQQGWLFADDSYDRITYWVGYDALDNRVSVGIVSFFPWDEGTTDLLNAFHIELT